MQSGMKWWHQDESKTTVALADFRWAFVGIKGRYPAKENKTISTQILA
jgi:hypothetical protein